MGRTLNLTIFEIEPKPHMSVLEALFQIQDETDSTLAFRYSCRGAVCGSCAMLINKKQRLACRTQVSEIVGEKVLMISTFGPLAKPEFKIGNEILIEPLPNLPLIKDLIVDMKPFFKHYGSVKPWFDIENTNPQVSLMSQEETKKLDKYASCILCGLCYGSCPVSARDKELFRSCRACKSMAVLYGPKISGSRKNAFQSGLYKRRMGVRPRLQVCGSLSQTGASHKCYYRTHKKNNNAEN